MNARYRSWQLLVRLLFEPDGPSLRSELERRVGTDVDAWAPILSIANFELVTPVMWQRIAEKELANLVPAEVVEYLEAFCDLNLARNLAIRSQALECMRALDSAGIATLPIKGAAYLLRDADPLPRSRIVKDIDIVVPAAQIEAARAVLEGRGFAPSVNQKYDFSNHHHVDPLARPSDVVPVELHHAFVLDPLGPMLPVDEIWQHALECGAGDLSFRVPTDADSIALIVAHNAVIDRYVKTLAIPLRALLDIHWLMGRSATAPDWAGLIARARAVGAEPEVRRFLGMLSLLDGRVPLGRLAPRFADRLYYRFCLGAVAVPGLEKWAERLDRLSSFQIRRLYADELTTMSPWVCRGREMLAMVRRGLSGHSAAPGADRQASVEAGPDQ